MSPPSSTVPRSEGAPKPASYEKQRESWAGRRPEGRIDDPYALQKERERSLVIPLHHSPGEKKRSLVLLLKVPSKPPTRELAATFLRVALEADRDIRAQQAPGEKRQYPAGAMPDKSPLKRRKRVRF